MANPDHIDLARASRSTRWREAGPATRAALALALATTIHATLLCGGARAEELVWFGPNERRSGDLAECLKQFGTESALYDLQRCADISRHAAEVLVRVDAETFSVGDLAFVHANAVGTCDRARVEIPRKAIGRIEATPTDDDVSLQIVHPGGVCEGAVVVKRKVLDKIDAEAASTLEPKTEADLRYRVYRYLQGIETVSLLPVPSKQGFGPLASLIEGMRSIVSFGLRDTATVDVYSDEPTLSKMKAAYPADTARWTRREIESLAWLDLPRCTAPSSPRSHDLGFSSQFPGADVGPSLARCIQKHLDTDDFIAAGPYSWINQHHPQLVANGRASEAMIPFDSVWQYPLLDGELPESLEAIAAAAKDGRIELMVTYGMHTLHQVQEADQSGNANRLRRVAYAEGNLALGIHNAELNKPTVIFAFCPATPPEGVGRCREIPTHHGISASWIERMTDEQATAWLRSPPDPERDTEHRVIIVYYEKAEPAHVIHGMARAATLPVGFEGASFGPTLQLLRKQFFSFWDIPGEGTALPQGVQTRPGEYLVLEAEELRTYKLGTRDPLDEPLAQHDCLSRLINVTNAVNPEGARTTYKEVPEAVTQPRSGEGLNGVTGLYSIAGAKIIEDFIRDAKHHRTATEGTPAACLASYYIDSWNLADSYENDMALQMLEALLRDKAWKPSEE